MTVRPRESLRPVAIVYVVVQALPALLLVVFLVGGLLLSGGQVAADQSANWDAILPFPVFPVPAWLLIALGAIGVVCALVWALRSRDEEALALSGALGVTAAACVASMVFGLAFLGDPDLAGPFWVGMLLALACAVILVIAERVRGRTARAAAAAAARGSEPPRPRGSIVLPVGLLVLGVLLFLFLGYGALGGWIEVFALGTDHPVDTGGLGSRTAETPAVITALLSTFFALVGALAAGVGIWDLRRRRRPSSGRV